MKSMPDAATSKTESTVAQGNLLSSLSSSTKTIQNVQVQLKLPASGEQQPQKVTIQTTTMPQESRQSTLISQSHNWTGNNSLSGFPPSVTYPYDSDITKKGFSMLTGAQHDMSTKLDGSAVSLPPPPPVLPDYNSGQSRKRKMDNYGEGSAIGGAPTSFVPDFYQTDFVHRRRTSSNNSIPEFIHRSRTVSNNSLGPLDFLPRDRSLSNNSLILPTPFTTATSATGPGQKRMDDSNNNYELLRYLTENESVSHPWYYLQPPQQHQQQQNSGNPRQSPMLPPQKLNSNKQDDISHQRQQARQPHYEPSPSHTLMMQQQQQQLSYYYANQASRRNFEAPNFQQQLNPPTRFPAAPHAQTKKQTPKKEGVANVHSNKATQKATTNQPKRRKIVKTPSAITSHYRGVCWYKRTGRWVVQIKVNGMRRHVGYFTCEHEAAQAYDKALAEMIEEVKKKPQRAGMHRNRIFNPEKRKPNLDVAQLEALQKQLSEDRKSAKPNVGITGASSSTTTNSASASAATASKSA